MAKRRAKLVEVRHGHPGHALGRTAKPHNLVAYSGDQGDVLADVLKDNLSPEGVAVIARHLEPAANVHPDTDREVAWFRSVLVELLGGEKALDRTCKELGL